MKPKALIIAIMFDKWISHFKTCVQACKRNLALINRHLLILNGHNLHMIIDDVHNTRKVGLDLIILPSHTSHVLQPFDVACFKPFKIAFKAYKNV